MRITWFTDPAKSEFNSANPKEGRFSSYYQYDTVTKKFVRIRLELGRPDSGSTKAMFNENRYIGFSKTSLSTKKSKWRVSPDDSLQCDGKDLRKNPAEGDRVYDTSDPKSFVHRGNPIIGEPNLPAGINKNHLALLANEVMINRRNNTLTSSDATPALLSETLKNNLSRIMNKDIDLCTNEEVGHKLIEQTQAINGETMKKTFEDHVEEINEEINEEIIDGATPNKEFVEAFNQMQKSFQDVRGSIASGNFTTASKTLADASTKIKTAIQGMKDQLEEWESDALLDSLDALETIASVSNQQVEYEEFINNGEETVNPEEPVETGEVPAEPPNETIG